MVDLRIFDFAQQSLDMIMHSRYAQENNISIKVDDNMLWVRTRLDDEDWRHCFIVHVCTYKKTKDKRTSITSE